MGAAAAAHCGHASQYAQHDDDVDETVGDEGGSGDSVTSQHGGVEAEEEPAYSYV